MRKKVSYQRDLWWLLALLVMVFAPFFWQLPLPTTGDQKTYMAQAMEMAASGSWLKQTLFGLPNYYKGPLLFVCLRIGFLVFGPWAPAALIFANLLGYGFAVWIILKLMTRYLPDRRDLAVLAAGATILSTGAFAHGLAAQMEALLVVCYAVFMAALGLADKGESGAGWRRLAWIMAGTAGLLKSPLHSVLLGTSAILYWTWTKQLGALARRPSEWLSLLVGIVIGALPYAVLLTIDFEPFYATYIEREHLTRGTNQNDLIGAIGPFVGGQLQPFILMLLIGLFARRRLRGGNADLSLIRPDLARLVTSMMVPTGLFFAWHHFHSDIYFLPLLAPISIWTALVVGKYADTHPRLWLVARLVTAFLLVIVAVVLDLIVARFYPFPSWWSGYRTPAITAALVVVIVSAVVFVTRKNLLKSIYALLIATAALYVGAGQLLIGLEAHERAGFEAAASGYEARSWARLNLTENLWADQALLSVLLQRPIGVVNNREQLRRALSEGTVLFVLDDTQLATAKEEAASLGRGELLVRPYQTWRVHGRAANGQPAWRVAWQERSMTPLEQTEYAVLLN